MAGLNRKTGPVVPFDAGAGVMRGWPLAPEFEKAPALARAFVVEGMRELSLVVEGAGGGINLPCFLRAQPENSIAASRSAHAYFIALPSIMTCQCGKQAVRGTLAGAQAAH